ncbi:TPA: hypothetical protein ACOEN9_004508, partial [Stenotrophomonas maltophilia]
TETAGLGLLFFYVCFSAGLRPAPADASFKATATATATATANAGIPWFGGAVSECGDAASTSV